jgi:serine/threonine protein kinase
MSEESPNRVLAGRYRLITRLGHRVMRGWDTHLRQVVAVRMLPQPDTSGQVTERACALVDLVHPGLVRVLDAGNDGGESFLVAEFIAATTLKTRLTDGPLPAATVEQMGVMLARALAYAHSHDVVHRDIRPGNVLLGPGDEPYLTDLGIAETATPAYMAPEQVGGKPPSAAADIYSLGLVLLESLTGRTEYRGDDIATARARLTHPPRIPDDLPYAKAIAAMTAADPKDRPDANTCADLLRGSSEKSRVQTRTVLIAAVAAATVATAVAVFVNLSERPPPPRQASVEEPLRQLPTATTQVPPRSSTATTTTSAPSTPPPQTIAAVSDASAPPVTDTTPPAYNVGYMQPAMYPPPVTADQTTWYKHALEHARKPPKKPKAPEQPKAPEPTTVTPLASEQPAPEENNDDKSGQH